MGNIYSTIQNCRISESKNLVGILDLGLHPLANSLKNTSGEKEKKIPLSISFCPESSLLQLDETVNKELLFKNN